MLKSVFPAITGEITVNTAPGSNNKKQKKIASVQELRHNGLLIHDPTDQGAIKVSALY